MHARKSVSLAVLGLVSPFLLSAPAHAATKVKDDPDDAPARIDITKVRYTYGDGTVRVSGTVPELGDFGRGYLTISRYEVFEAGYVLRIIKKAGEEPRVRLLYFDHFDLEPSACSRTAGSWGDQRIRMRVSTDCLDGHARPRTYLRLTTAKGEELDEGPVARLRED